MSKGEYRVGTDFNPTGEFMVTHIKELAAELIDVIEKISFDAPRHPASHGEIVRLKALAQTAIEEGAMWAVKAATKPAPEMKES